MNEYISLINYLNSIVKDFSDKLISQGFDINDVTVALYKNIICEKINFHQFDNNYYNCEAYKDLNIANALKYYIYAVYYLVQYYFDSKNIDENPLCELLINFDVSASIIDESFCEEGIGIEMVDNYIVYTNFSEARRKRLVEKFEQDEHFNDVLENNGMMKILYTINKNLAVTEEEYIIDDIMQAFDANIECEEIENCDKVKIDTSEKIKKQLSLGYFIKDLNSKNSTAYIKRAFCIIIKNIYTEIYYAKRSKGRKLSDNDNQFYNLIESNELSFENLFQKFLNDKVFSNYIINTFYSVNVDSSEVELQDRNSVFKKDGVEEKVKKYIID